MQPYLVCTFTISLAFKAIKRHFKVLVSNQVFQSIQKLIKSYERALSLQMSEPMNVCAYMYIYVYTW